jgi:hypothetical protein
VDDWTADFAIIRFSCFAAAAFVRSCGTCIVATQLASSIRSFICIVLDGTEPALSLQTVQTSKMRDEVDD